MAESVTMLSERADRRFDELEYRLDTRIFIVEEVVRGHSDDLRKVATMLERATTEIKKEVARFRHDFEHRDDLAPIAALEERIARVEAKIGMAS